MSGNIHRLGDYNDDQSNRNAQQQQPQRQPQYAAQQQPQGQPQPQQQGGQPNQPQPQPFGGGILGGGGGPNPGGSIYPPINKVLAPNFTIRSFIFWVSMIQICVFIAELFVGQFVEDGAFVADNDMAGPGTETLKIMGAKYLPCIQDGEVYRFISPAFLHSGILHIFTNLVSQTMIGYTCELHWGFWRMFSFYFATGIMSERSIYSLY